MTVNLIVGDFGPMGFGLFLLPFSLLINLFLIPALHDLSAKQSRFEIINTIGLLFIIILSGILLYFRLKNSIF